jgi:hypothetical protein
VTDAPKHPGRPPATGVTRSESILIRLTPDERRRFERAAKRAGKALATWMRDLAIDETEKR